MLLGYMVEISNSTRDSVDLDFLRSVAIKVLSQEQRKDANLSVAFVDAKRMAEIMLTSNVRGKTYKGKKKVANVLSFPFTDNQGKPMKEFGLGEIVLCKSVIAKDAKKYGITVKNALAFMMVHGILHLVGYSHTAMQNKESFYLSRLL